MEEAMGAFYIVQ